MRGLVTTCALALAMCCVDCLAAPTAGDFDDDDYDVNVSWAGQDYQGTENTSFSVENGTGCHYLINIVAVDEDALDASIDGEPMSDDFWVSVYLEPPDTTHFFWLAVRTEAEVIDGQYGAFWMALYYDEDGDKNVDVPEDVCLDTALIWTH